MENKLKLDIVDTQIHAGPGRIEETVAAMDALGIRSVVMDEYWLRSFNAEPHHVLPTGDYRPICPTAELAAQLYPERFSWVLRVRRLDPEYASIVRIVRDSPFGRALRIDPGMSPLEVKAFAEGHYDHLLKASAENNLPIFFFMPDQPELIAKCAEKFPELRIIVDHCGIYSNGMRTTIGGGDRAFSPQEQMAMFEKVLALSKYENIAMKWAHTSDMFDTPVYPGTALQPILRKAIDSFGADRIMWASDFSVNQLGETWAEILFSVKGNATLSDVEAAAILGGTARKWLNWPL